LAASNRRPHRWSSNLAKVRHYIRRTDLAPRRNSISGEPHHVTYQQITSKLPIKRRFSFASAALGCDCIGDIPSLSDLEAPPEAVVAAPIKEFGMVSRQVDTFCVVCSGEQGGMISWRLDRRPRHEEHKMVLHGQVSWW
jgi:hypothetical protein